MHIHTLYMIPTYMHGPRISCTPLYPLLGIIQYHEHKREIPCTRIYHLMQDTEYPNIPYVEDILLYTTYLLHAMHTPYGILPMVYYMGTCIHVCSMYVLGM